MSAICKFYNRKVLIIVGLIVLVTAIVVLTATLGHVVSSDENTVAMEAAKNAYQEKFAEDNEIVQKWILFDADGRWVALKEGTPIGVYENADEAVNALVEDSADYQIIPSLTDKIYYVLDVFDPVIDISDYTGKKIACIGDSVTYGVGATPDPNYVENLGTALNTTAINLGTSGSSLCKGGDRTCQFSKLNADDLQGADIVTIYLGVNDWAAAGYENGKPFYALGKPDTKDKSTIYGAMKMWCDKIAELKETEQYKDTAFYFVTPHLTSWNNSVTDDRAWDQNKQNIHGYTQKQMSEVIKEVCDAYDIPVIDMYSFTCKLYNQNPTKYIEEYAGDGVHPTAACHKLMTDYILMYLSAK